VAVTRVWGKAVFVAADVAIAAILLDLLVRRGVQPLHAVGFTSTFLFLPLSINVSTRGSADALVCLVVLAMLRALVSRRHLAAACW